MTVHALLVDPPREGLVLSNLPETSPLTETEAADLYAAMVRDSIAAVAGSGGDLLVNYRPNDLLPADYRGPDVEDELRELAGSVLEDADDVRFEVQVGSTYDARVGNTVTHLLREEDVATVAVLDATSPTIARTDLDSAAMKLRSSEVVMAPAPGGRVSYLGLAEPIDFDGAFATPALATLAERTRDAGFDADFLPMHPVVETGDDLVTLLSVLRARRTAGRFYPERTAAALDDIGLRVVDEDGEGRIERE